MNDGDKGITCTLGSDLKSQRWFILAVSGVMGPLGIYAALLILGLVGTYDDIDWFGMFGFGLASLFWFGVPVSWTLRREREWRSLGAAELTLVPYPPKLGQSLSCRIRFERPPRPGTAVTAHLYCVTTNLMSPYRNPRRSVTVEWAQRALTPTASTMQFNFRLPDDVGRDSLAEVRWAHLVALGSDLFQFAGVDRYRSGAGWWLRIDGQGGSAFQRFFKLPPIWPAEGQAPPLSPARIEELRAREAAERIRKAATKSRSPWSDALGVILMVVGFALIALAVAFAAWVERS